MAMDGRRKVRFWKFSAVVAVAIACSAFATYPPKSSQDWAAWVQAVGSIGAILATLGVVRQQHRLEAQRHEDWSRRAYLAEMEPVADLVASVYQRIRLASDVLHGIHLAESYDKAEDERRGDRLHRMLIDLRPEELPRLGLRLQIMELKDVYQRTLDLMIGSRAVRTMYWRERRQASPQEMQEIWQLSTRAAKVKDVFDKEVGRPVGDNIEI